MDGSPSTQIRLNIKKNKSSACTRRRRRDAAQSVRQTDGRSTVKSRRVPRDTRERLKWKHALAVLQGDTREEQEGNGPIDLRATRAMILLIKKLLIDPLDSWFSGLRLRGC